MKKLLIVVPLLLLIWLFTQEIRVGIEGLGSANAWTHSSPSPTPSPCQTFSPDDQPGPDDSQENDEVCPTPTPRPCATPNQHQNIVILCTPTPKLGTPAPGRTPTATPTLIPSTVPGDTSTPTGTPIPMISTTPMPTGGLVPPQILKAPLGLPETGDGSSQP